MYSKEGNESMNQFSSSEFYNKSKSDGSYKQNLVKNVISECLSSSKGTDPLKLEEGADKIHEENVHSASVIISNNTKNGKSNISEDSLEHQLFLKVKNDKLARRKYLCTKCRAHGQDVSVRMHKRKCPFKNCECTSCAFVNGRFIVAKQISLNRYATNSFKPLG